MDFYRRALRELAVTEVTAVGPLEEGNLAHQVGFDPAAFFHILRCQRLAQRDAFFVGGSGKGTQSLITRASSCG